MRDAAQLDTLRFHLAEDFNALWSESDRRLQEAVEAKSNELTLRGDSHSTALLREHRTLYARALHQASDGLLAIASSLLLQLKPRSTANLKATFESVAVEILTRHASDYDARMAHLGQLMGLAGKNESVQDTLRVLSQNLPRRVSEIIGAFEAHTAKRPLVQGIFGYFLVTVGAGVVAGLLLVLFTVPGRSCRPAG